MKDRDNQDQHNRLLQWRRTPTASNELIIDGGPLQNTDQGSPRAMQELPSLMLLVYHY